MKHMNLGDLLETDEFRKEYGLNINDGIIVYRCKDSQLTKEQEAMFREDILNVFNTQEYQKSKATFFYIQNCETIPSSLAEALIFYCAFKSHMTCIIANNLQKKVLDVMSKLTNLNAHIRLYRSIEEANLAVLK